MRKITIDDEQWKYTVGTNDVVIWSPLKRRYHIEIAKMFNLIGIQADWYAVQDMRENRCLHVTPGHIRRYIEILV